MLERGAQGELENSRIRGAIDLHEVAPPQPSFGVTKVDVVEQVERLESELHSNALRNWEVLVQPEV